MSSAVNESGQNAHATSSQLTREALLEAGLRLLQTIPATAAFGHLTAAKVAAEAGRTTGSFFHQWPTQEAYLQDFIAYVLRPDLAVNLRDTATAVQQHMGIGETFGRALSAAGTGVPERTGRDPQTVVELLLWNRAMHDPGFQERVAPLYARLDAGAGEVFAALADGLGREPRPPFTPELMGAICTALAQGLALRASVTPGFYPDQLFGWIVAAIAPLMTRTPGDTLDAEGWVSALDVLGPRAE